MNENENYTITAREAAEIIQRLASALAMTEGNDIYIDIVPIIFPEGKGNANLFVDGFLAATLRGKVI